jgi:hypothetical protein
MGKPIRLILLVFVALVGIVAGAAVSSGMHFGEPSSLVSQVDVVAFGDIDHSPGVIDHAHETLCLPMRNARVRKNNLSAIWIVKTSVAWECTMAFSFERPPRPSV